MHLSIPALELHDISGTLIESNDNAAILARLQPGDYTAIVRGSGGTTGVVALMEAYSLH